MSPADTVGSLTQHGLLVVWGQFAQHLGLIQAIEEGAVSQKTYRHRPQTKILEFLVAVLAGLEHLKDLSRAAHALDQDAVVAQAWGQPAWADASGVSRTLQALTAEEGLALIQVLQTVSQPFIDQEVVLAMRQQGRLVYDGDGSRVEQLAGDGSRTVYLGSWLEEHTPASSQVYNNTFEGTVGSEWSNSHTDTTPRDNRHFLGQFGNQTTSLTLNNLPAHTSANLSLDVYVIRTWDGNGNHCCGPDRFSVAVAGGATLLDTTFSKSGADGNTQSYPGNYNCCSYPQDYGAAEVNSLGYDNRGDAVYHLSYTFAHSASSITLNFSGSGLESLANESWGLDNVSLAVDLAATPTGMPTYTPSATPTRTNTATNTATATPGFTATNTPTHTSTNTPTPTVTRTPSPTVSPTPTITPFGCMSAPDGLVSWWTADNTPADFRGLNPGLRVGGVTYAPGQSNAAFLFDGSTGTVRVADSSSLHLPTALTLSAWVYPTGPGSNATYGGTILAKEGEWALARFPDKTIRLMLTNTSPFLRAACCVRRDPGQHVRA